MKNGRLMLVMLATLVAFLALASIGSTQTPAAAPALSEAQQKDLEIARLSDVVKDLLKRNSDLMVEIGRLHQQLGPLQEEKNTAAVQQKLDALKAGIDKANPAHTWDPNGGFAPKPADKIEKKDEGKKQD